MNIIEMSQRSSSFVTGLWELMEYYARRRVAPSEAETKRRQQEEDEHELEVAS